MPILEVESLSIAFGENYGLKDVSISIIEGEFLVVFGGTGCGKSLFFRAVTGLQRPTSGHVRLFGHDIHDLGRGQWSQIQQRIGTAIYGGALLKALTAMENIMLPLYELDDGDERKDSDWLAQLVDRLGLEKLANLSTSALSRGEVQRVGLARALILKPEILICDDIFSGLDWHTRDRMVDFLEELRARTGLTIVICTASPEIGMRVADRLLILDRGNCIAIGSPTEIREMEDPMVRSVFLTHIEAMQRFGDFADPEAEARPS